MGPPPYGRSLTVPYQKPLSLMERKMSQEQSQSFSPKPNLLVPEFSDFNNTFEVDVKRNSLGLGFSIDGGPDAPAPWTNLVRVKKIFPLQPAWETGKLRIGDILLRVSGVPLSGLSLRQALDILRSSPAVTVLQVCRVTDNCGNSWGAQPAAPRQRSSIVRSYSYGPVSVPAMAGILTPRRPGAGTSTEHPGPSITPSSNLSLCSGESMDIEISPPSPSTSSASSREWSPAEEDSETLDILKPVETTLRNSGGSQSQTFYGEFTINLKKVNGSLGFTLRQTDDTVLKHTIKALVKEPAISDGRLRPGDKLLSCNGVDLSSHSHQELITFLRQCPESNTLTLYRDASRSQTPLTPDNCQFESLVSAVSSAPAPQEVRNSLSATWGQEKRTSQSPSRKHLRYEAAELVRSLQSSRNSLDKVGLGSNPGSYSSGTLGRRLGRPYSPAMKERHQLLLSPAPPSSGPTVESPVTPHNSSAPASLGLSQALTSLKLETGVSIEEVTDSGDSASGGCSPDITEAISAPHSPVKEPLAPLFNSNQTKSLPRGTTSDFILNSESDYCEKRERPNELNFNVDQKKKQGFIFNSNWNFNKNKY